MAAPILRPGANCWRGASAERLALLVDGEAYFRAFKAAVLGAREQVLIVGWDIDSRLRLERRDPLPDVPDDLIGLLCHLAERRPELQIRILVWDFSMIYAGGREALPSVRFNWKTPSNVRAEFDDALPVGGAQHQKIVVIDDRLAFVGGLDLTERRWDTPKHLEDDPHRVDSHGKPYGPYHDVMAMFAGPAAALAGDVARERWAIATGAELPKPAGRGEDVPWPEHVVPDFEDVELAIARTRPPVAGVSEVREVEQLYLDSIAAARELIFAENQYLTTRSVVDALKERLAEPDGPEVVILLPERYDGWMEAQTMGAARASVVVELRGADVHGRLLVLAPCLGHEKDHRYTIHAKVMVIDDRFLRVGSSNLNNRSMSIDSECDVALESDEPRVREAIAGFRQRLLACHVGMEPAEFAELEANGSLVDVLRQLPATGRCLAPIEAHSSGDRTHEALATIADPEQVPDIADLLARASEGDVETPTMRRFLGRLWRVGAMLAVIGAFAALWRYTPLSEWVHPAAVTRWFEATERSTVAPLLAIGIYVVAGAVAFPVTVLIAATAVAFGPWLGLLYATTGSMVSALVMYAVGRSVGRKPLRWLIGRRIHRLDRYLERSGVVSVLAVRMLPIAPFTMVNAAAGAARVKLFDYVVGTLLGLAPGIVIMTAMGGQVRALATDSGPWRWVALLGLFVLWVLVGWGLQRFSRRRSERRVGRIDRPRANRASAEAGDGPTPRRGLLSRVRVRA